MKKETKKKIINISLILLVLLITSTVMFAAGESYFPNGGGTASVRVTTISKKIWSTVQVVFQVLSFSAIVIAGLKYMFAAPEEKADIKKGLIIIVLGSVLVFSASTFAGFVYDVASEVL